MVDSAEQWTLVVKGVPKKGLLYKESLPPTSMVDEFFFGIFGIEALL